MSEIADLMNKYGLKSLSLHWAYPGRSRVAAWLPPVGDNGCVQISPSEPGVMWTDTAEKAVQACLKRACIPFDNR